MNALIKTAKTLFNALAFANAGNYSEFRALLRQVDETAGFPGAQASHKLADSASDNAAMTPAIHNLRHAA